MEALELVTQWIEQERLLYSAIHKRFYLKSIMGNNIESCYEIDGVASEVLNSMLGNQLTILNNSKYSACMGIVTVEDFPNARKPLSSWVLLRDIFFLAPGRSL
jgi:hypothetical protein|tara:strand:- start:379 stop:687 length:309 start_codon:yes stop_codon:yes gene_type:complete